MYIRPHQNCILVSRPDISSCGSATRHQLFPTKHEPLVFTLMTKNEQLQKGNNAIVHAIHLKPYRI